MADPVPSQLPSDTTSNTITISATDSQDGELPTLMLRLKKKPKNNRKVQWTTETVDNEEMNKKKSKCCCIFKKPKQFGESSSDSDSDDECEHCQGHVEKKKTNSPPAATENIEVVPVEISNPTPKQTDSPS